MLHNNYSAWIMGRRDDRRLRVRLVHLCCPPVVERCMDHLEWAWQHWRASVRYLHEARSLRCQIYWIRAIGWLRLCVVLIMCCTHFRADHFSGLGMENHGYGKAYALLEWFEWNANSELLVQAYEHHRELILSTSVTRQKTEYKGISSRNLSLLLLHESRDDHLNLKGSKYCRQAMIS